MGKAAVPKLLDMATGETKTGADLFAAGCCASVLVDIGKVAVDDVRNRWPKLDDKMRWRLMEFRGRYDYDQAADYALECLKSKDAKLSLEAWSFLLKHKEKRIQDEFYRNLRGECEGTPCTYVIRREPVFDAEKEVDLLIALLAPDSWMALDKGYPARPRTIRNIPNDERYFVIDALAFRKAKRAAPAMFKMLVEKGPGRAYFAGQIVPILAEFGYKEAIPELKRILEADEKLFTNPGKPYSPPWIKMLTARALWQLGDAKGREYLTPFLAKEHKWDTRRLVAEAYALYGEKADIPFLAGLLDDSDSGVRTAACQGLERVSGVNIHAPMKPWRRGDQVDAPLWKEWYKKEYSKKPQ
jgi:hypothetical protein